MAARKARGAHYTSTCERKAVEQAKAETATWKQRAQDATASYKMEAEARREAVAATLSARTDIFYMERDIAAVEDDAHELTKVIKKVHHQRDAMVRTQHSTVSLLARTLEPDRQPSKALLKQTKVEAVEQFQYLKAARNAHIDMVYEGPGYGGRMATRECSCC